MRLSTTSLDLSPGSGLYEMLSPYRPVFLSWLDICLIQVMSDEGRVRFSQRSFSDGLYNLFCVQIRTLIADK
jgi:hypothetical protein